jgi:outer membrane protein assembly factor BamB
VVTSATGKIRSYDLASGKLLWECRGMTANAIPSPVPGDDVVYATSGFRGAALMAIKLGGSGDVTDSDTVLWKHTRSTPYVPSPLLYQGKLYFISVNNALVSIVDAKDGKVNVDAERIPELNGVYASPVAANGRVYIVGRNGATAVLKAGEKMEILATNKLDEKIDASPAIAGRHLFLRGHESLYCISE